jgi:signal transduction histidine kinase
VRNAAPVDHRVHALWVTLAAAAAAALAVGVLLAVGLARWIGRPLEELRTAAAAIGRGDTGARACENSGPPEIRTLAVTFNDMSERLGALLHTQRLMTSDVSHQLRTPLSALRLRLELLAEDVGEPQRAELDGALREIARLSRLADGLLAVARAEQTATTPEPVDVAAVVHERVELWAPLANERGVTLTTHLSPARALATPGHLEQVLDNCLANALDAVDFGGRIGVTVHTESSSVVLNIIDNGAGMPEDQRKTAFTRFASDRNRPGNTGLGLTIVASLVAADHGTTSLRPTSGGGLTVVIGLPAAALAPAVTEGV